MLLDAQDVEEGAELSCDVCIVGGGPAGITLARELATHGTEVCVLESGGLKPEARTQSLYEGENAGGRYLPQAGRERALTGSRLRMFGGSTNHWQGICRPLDPIDFEARDGVADTGWPIRRGELEPYYPRAHRLCELGPYTYDAEDWTRRTRTALYADEARLTSAVFQFSTPTRFGEAYRADLERARRARVVLHANAVGLDMSRSGSSVERVRVATLGGKRFSVRPRRVVLAAGGIENARLLLASNGERPRGIGNEHDLVGRFFADHLIGPIAVIAVPKAARALDFYRVETSQRTHALGVITTSDDFVKEESLLRVAVYVGDLGPQGQDDSIAAGIPKLLRTSEAARDVTLRGLYMTSEVAPNPENRVSLGRERDPLGIPRVKLDWRVGEREQRSAIRTLEVIARSFGRRGIGRVYGATADDGDFVTDVVRGGSHHMGTTRMAADPRQGVVDADCRVHGTSNLYVAGSSVFSSWGFSNPTLTIVALALRLASTLSGRRA